MKSKLAFILIIFIFCGCSSGRTSNDSTQKSENLTVSAAISLKDAFTEIGHSYKTKTGRTIDFNFGASGALQQQIESGAPVDVFASAGESQMDELENRGLVVHETRKDFAQNSLVLIVPKNSGNTVLGFKVLAETSVQKIAIGNPKTVPAGQYAEESLEKMNLLSATQNKFIFAENVRQVLDYVARGEVDAGIVYASDAQTAIDKVDILAVADENTHSPILYPIAIIKNSQQNETAKEFINFVMNAEAQGVLRKYGFKNAAEK